MFATFARRGRYPQPAQKAITAKPEGRVEHPVTEIKLKRGESVDRALRRLKKKMDKEGTMKEIRNHRYFEKPCEKRRRKAARSRFS
jgi:small subunit ribosomal protein S21